MSKYLSVRYTLFLILSDLLLVIIALLLSFEARIMIPIGGTLLDPSVSFPKPVYAIAVIIWATILPLLNVYASKRAAHIVTELQTLTVASFAAWFCFMGALYLTFRLVSRLHIVYFIIVYLILVYAHRIALRLVFKLRRGRRFSRTNIVIIGANELARDIATSIRNHEWLGFYFTGFICNDCEVKDAENSLLGTLSETQAIIQRENISEVVFALDPHKNDDAKQLIYQLQNLPVNIRVIPDYFDLTFLRMSIDELGGITLLTLKQPVLDPVQRALKRILDVVLASLMLIMALPVMLVIAVLVRLDSPGPAMFTQMRVGEGQRLFKMYKFRSMRESAEAEADSVAIVDENGNVLHKHPDDPRITRAGRFLRRSSLDELPQLINVLRGDMSLVGPRPELPDMVDKYEWWQLKRFEVPQGMTGWWQINGRAERPMHLSTEQDLYYIQHYSVLLDLQILWGTVGVVLGGRGAY